MRAVVYHGRNNISVDEVGEPQVIDPTDAVVKVTASALCGADLHAYGGYMPGLEDGDVLGHEFVGEVVATGGAVRHVRPGQRVLAAFHLSCGECGFCKDGQEALCDRSNPDKALAESIYGQSPAGMFGGGHVFGGHRGGHTEYVRVPFAHTGLFLLPDWLSDEQALSLADTFPAGYAAAERCGITGSDTVAIWGAGAVGQFAAISATLLGAKQVVVIDRLPERLSLVRHYCPQAVTLNFAKEHDIPQRLKSLTGGRGPDICIDAVGQEAHSTGLPGLYDRARHLARLGSGRPDALREAINACRKGGLVSVAGTYSGFADRFPIGAVYMKGLRLMAGQAHAQRYIPPLMALIRERHIDPSFIVTHRMPLEQAPEAFQLFRDKRDGCVRVVLRP